MYIFLLYNRTSIYCRKHLGNHQFSIGGVDELAQKDRVGHTLAADHVYVAAKT